MHTEDVVSTPKRAAQDGPSARPFDGLVQYDTNALTAPARLPLNATFRRPSGTGGSGGVVAHVLDRKEDAAGRPAGRKCRKNLAWKTSEKSGFATRCTLLVIRLETVQDFGVRLALTGAGRKRAEAGIVEVTGCGDLWGMLSSGQRGPAAGPPACELLSWRDVPWELVG